MDERMSDIAAHSRLVSTLSSKYAHLPGSMIRGWGDTACGRRLASYDVNDPRHDAFAEGKPPCPDCASRLRHRIEWLAEFEESYLLLAELGE